MECGLERSGLTTALTFRITLAAGGNPAGSPVSSIPPEAGGSGTSRRPWGVTGGADVGHLLPLGLAQVPALGSGQAAHLVTPLVRGAVAATAVTGDHPAGRHHLFGAPERPQTAPDGPRTASNDLRAGSCPRRAQASEGARKECAMSDVQPENDLGGTEFSGEHPDEPDVPEQPHPEEEDA